MCYVKSRLPLLILLSFVLLLITGCSNQKPVDVYDGFETKSLSGIWSTDRMEMHSLEFQQEIVHSGQSAAKITLRTGDVIEAGNDSSKASERDELREADHLMSKEGATYRFQFSMFLPDSFPTVSTRLVIAQWKQECPADQCSDDSPVLAVRYVSGKLFVTLNTDTGRTVLYELKDEVRNKWLNFRFDIRFSQRADGEVQAYLNNQQIINYHGLTSYTSNRGYKTTANKYYFKMGLYRDRMPEPMTIYIDDYTKKELVVEAK